MHPQSKVKNSFAKLVLEYGNQEQKNDFLQQVSHLNLEKRGGFLNGLRNENIALILREIESQRIQLSEGNSGMTALDKIATELNGILLKRSMRDEEERQGAFACVRVGEIDQDKIGGKRKLWEGCATKSAGADEKPSFTCVRGEKKFVDGAGNEGVGLSPRVVGVDEVAGSKSKSLNP